MNQFYFEDCLIEKFVALVPESLLDKPGRVFYSGCNAFASENGLYILGLNSSGDPLSVTDTVQSNIDQVLHGELDSWSRYEEGNNPFHRRMQHLFKRIDTDPKTVPSSNLVFLRSQSAKELGKAKLKRLAEDCWCFHQTVIEELKIKVVVCLGKKTSKFVRGFLNILDGPADSFIEHNCRQWKSHIYRNSDGPLVVELTHPSTVDWITPSSDPTGLVREALNKSRTLL